MISVHNVTGGYAGTSIIKDVSFQVNKGELFGILGPNGSGKTTLMKMLSAILPFTNGEIAVKGRKLSNYRAKDLARIMAVLPQHSSQAFSYSVKETVSLGRYPHQKGLFQSWTDEDEAVVERVMNQTGVAQFADHSIHELSGGERQRVFLAQALAQEPEILLLDEPTNHLDLSFQKELLDSLKQWSMENELTVVSIFHDLNLAGLYCDRLLLLENGEINALHGANEVLKEERIQAVYNTSIKKHWHPEVSAPQIMLMPKASAGDEDNVIIHERYLKLGEEHIVLRSPIKLRTLSSGVTGAGLGWYESFVNRHVDKDYDCSDHRVEMQSYLKKHGFAIENTVGMMTAVMLKDVSYRLYEEGEASVFIVVTAGVGNAVDASRSNEHCFSMTPGTINSWIFINGRLTDEAFIQSVITTTEAKVKALSDLNIKDSVTGTGATGTSTDSMLIAATQKGPQHEYAGTITPLGKLIGKGVYECTKEAVSKSKVRIKS